MKILVFGVGAYYERRKKEFSKETEIVAYIDNNEKLWGNNNEIRIVSPRRVNEFDYDYIVLMSIRAVEMKKQLLEYGIEEEKIINFEQFIGLRSNRSMKIYSPLNDVLCVNEKKILIAIPELINCGAAIVVVHTAEVLMNMGYKVTILSMLGDFELVKNIIRKGITVILYGQICTTSIENMRWINKYDFIIANTFILQKFVAEISKEKEVIWWIHESGNMFKDSVILRGDIESLSWENIDLYGVSNVSKSCWGELGIDKEMKLLPFGIPDTGLTNLTNLESRKVVFAVIGYVNEIKGQDIFVDAIRLLSSCKDVEFWIIGNYGENSDYYLSLKEKLNESRGIKIKILGEVNHTEMEEVYKAIDVVVAPSRYDSFSAVIVEGMMNSKICIASEETGVASYIENGVNGFVCKSEDIKGLSEIMQTILEKRNQLLMIRDNARKTYEQHFTLEAFGNRLENILN